MPKPKPTYCPAPKYDWLALRVMMKLNRSSGCGATSAPRNALALDDAEGSGLAGSERYQ